MRISDWSSDVCSSDLRELARIHAITPDRISALVPQAPAHIYDFLRRPRPTPALDQIALYRADLDRRREAHPVLEWTLRRLERGSEERRVGEEVGSTCRSRWSADH